MMRATIFKKIAKTMAAEKYLFISATVVVALYLFYGFRKQQITYLESIQKPASSSLRDYPEDVKKKMRIFAKDRYVTFDEFADIEDLERSENLRNAP